MKVFVSFSGSRSADVAAALHEFLPLVLQNIEPFLAAADIEKGSRWQSEIAQRLDECNVGIVCCTSENLGQPWLNFEAGAVSKRVDSGRAMTYLLDLEHSQVPPPLSQFQHTKATRDETLKLCKSLNELMEVKLGNDKLERTFDKFWPELEAKLNAIRLQPAGAAPARRDPEEILEEVLETSREAVRLLRLQREDKSLYNSLVASFQPPAGPNPVLNQPTTYVLTPDKGLRRMTPEEYYRHYGLLPEILDPIDNSSS